MTVHGIGRVCFALDGDRIGLDDLYQRDPVRVLTPNPPRDDIPGAAFVTTSGGLVGGDRLELSARVADRASAQFVAQAAEKIYRTANAPCHIQITLETGADAWMEWLPQETIVFDGARLCRTTRANVASGGRLLAGEILVLGRGAMKERVLTGLVRDDWDVSRNGRLVWADALCLEGDIDETVTHPAGLGGATAVATAIYVADDASTFLETARALLRAAPDEVRVGATVVNGVLLVRLMAADPYPLRAAFGDFWAGFRHAAAGLAPVLPRLWHI